MQLALDEIQGNILPGFGSRFQQHIFVRFDRVDSVRDWVRALNADVTFASAVLKFKGDYDAWKLDSGRDKPTASFINVAFSRAGLVKLGVDTSQFPRAFTKQPAQRAYDLEDPGAKYPASDPAADWSVWPVGGQRTEADAYLILGAADGPALRDLTTTVTTALTDAGLTAFASYDGLRNDSNTEHFGFPDNVSQPVPETITAEGWENEVPPDGVVYAKPGEFVVGLEGEVARDQPDGPPWCLNGSYVVFRRLRQDRGLFTQNHATVVQALRTAATPAAADTVDDGVVDRMLMGRLKGDAGRGPLEFDEWGRVTPVFAHVRRAFPRDRTADADPPALHRLLRRGIPYGEDGQEQGLLFVAYQASIERQFEHIQRKLNDDWYPLPPNGGDPYAYPPRVTHPGPDPIAGQWPGGAGTLYCPIPGTQQPADLTCVKLPAVATPTGAGYFFAPSRQALGALADGTLPRATEN
jgi:Dyp-type peroxidase family